MSPLSEETIKNNKIEKIEDIIISIINSIAELHTIVVKSSNVKIDLLNISIYCGSLKKIESCTLGIIFTSKIDTKIKNHVHHLEGMHKSISN